MNEIIKKNGVSYGIGLAVLSILTTTVVYALSLYSAWWINISMMLLYVVVFIVLLIKTKKEMNGLITFKEAFTTYFIAMVIMLVVSTLFNIVLYNFVDPGATEVMKEEIIRSTVSFMESMNTPAEAINKTVEDLQKQDNFSIVAQLKGLAIAICVGSIFGLILALIFKSRPAHAE
ncbi:MAG: DUF4199 domain-containing protein [Proteobacteria bacterium]|nr:MAG: DUF4199 domain-containing protein [Pseudomonadota bacterium]